MAIKLHAEERLFMTCPPGLSAAGSEWLVHVAPPPTSCPRPHLWLPTTPTPSGEAVKLFIMAGLSGVEEGHGWEVLEWNLEGRREAGGTLGDRRAEFDNTHYVLLSGSYLSLGGKAYGMEFCPLARIQAAEKLLLLSTFLQQNCICRTSFK